MLKWYSADERIQNRWIKSRWSWKQSIIHKKITHIWEKEVTHTTHVKESLFKNNSRQLAT